MRHEPAARPRTPVDAPQRTGSAPPRLPAPPQTPPRPASGPPSTPSTPATPKAAKKRPGATPWTPSPAPPATVGVAPCRSNAASVACPGPSSVPMQRSYAQLPGSGRTHALAGGAPVSWARAAASEPDTAGRTDGAACAHGARDAGGQNDGAALTPRPTATRPA